jgi:hypothetical protein
MVDDVDTVLKHAKTIVIGNKDPDFQTIPERLHDGQCVVDLVRLANCRSNNGVYEGIC